ncbi:MAG TPA: hypothetical protein V6C52_03605 [Coleofasciculaceae cyanobacterium]|jgi:hypothetical protein
MSEHPPKQDLICLLEQWQAGIIDEQAVHGQAEAAYAAYREDEEDQLSAQDALIYHVVCVLEVLPTYMVIKEDVPFILNFLNTAPGREDEAMEAWDDYWNLLNYEARKVLLSNHPYYCNS